MYRFLRSTLFVFGGLLAGLSSQAQQTKSSPKYIDVAVTYTAERGKIASVDCGCFWMYGGSTNAAVTFYHGLGVAANLTGAHSSDIAPGVNLDKVSFMMGPRYTYRPMQWSNRVFSKERPVAFFAEGLIGGVHAFNTVVPSSKGAQGAASSFGIQAGGGMDWTLAHKVGVRLFEVDYVRSTLPNNADNVQHDLRVSGGISFHFKR